jgi:hypothetical protein
LKVSKKAEFMSGRGLAHPPAVRHKGPFSPPRLPDMGVLSRKSQLMLVLGHQKRPLTNCCDDAAIVELGPVQRSQSLDSRLGYLILEKTASRATCQG